VLINPIDVDDETVVVPADGAALVAVDADAVLVDEEAGRAFALNSTGALVWSLFDAGSPLGDVIDDVSDAFGVARDEVSASVHGLVRFFGELGFFENIQRDLASLPVDLQYVGAGDCGEPVPGPDWRSLNARYLEAPPNA